MATYEEVRAEFRKNPNATNRKKFLEARKKHIEQRQGKKKKEATAEATKKAATKAALAKAAKKKK